MKFLKGFLLRLVVLTLGASVLVWCAVAFSRFIEYLQDKNVTPNQFGLGLVGVTVVIVAIIGTLQEPTK